MSRLASSSNRDQFEDAGIPHVWMGRVRSTARERPVRASTTCAALRGRVYDPQRSTRRIVEAVRRLSHVPWQGDPRWSQVAPATRAVTAGSSRPEGAFWRETLAPYARPHLGRSLLDLSTSVVPYLALSYLMYLSLGTSYLLTLAIAIPTSGFLVRTFILFHDCSHGSLPALQAGEHVARHGARAARLLALPALAPRPCDAPCDLRRPRPPWGRRRPHADRGRVRRAARARTPRLPPVSQPADHVRRGADRRAARGATPRSSHGAAPHASQRDRHERRAGRCSSAALLADGLGALPARAGATVLLAGSAGIWLFYVQHQFEDAYWESAEAGVTPTRRCAGAPT